MSSSRYAPLWQYPAGTASPFAPLRGASQISPMLPASGGSSPFRSTTLPPALLPMAPNPYGPTWNPNWAVQNPYASDIQGPRGSVDLRYAGDRPGQMEMRRDEIAGDMWMPEVGGYVDLSDIYPGGYIDADEDGFIRTNAFNTPIDPRDPNRLMIGVFTTDGQFGQFVPNAAQRPGDLTPDGTIVPYSMTTLAPHAAIMGRPMVVDGGYDENGIPQPYNFIPPRAQGAVQGMNGQLPDGTRFIAIDGYRDPFIQEETAAHEIAHPLASFVAADPVAADAIAALRPALDAFATNSTGAIDRIYTRDLVDPNRAMSDEAYQRYLDEERVAEFIRIYIEDPEGIYNNYRQLWRQLIPIFEGVPEVMRYYQFAAANAASAVG